MSDKTHLTVDQILALGRFWALSAGEIDYLVNLLEYARAGTVENQEHFRKKIEQIRQESENLKNLVKRDSLEKTKDQALYYSSWLWMAIHFATSIAEYQTVTSLSLKFHLNPKQVLSILEKLMSLWLVVKNGELWQFNSGEFHLEKDSPLIAAHHQNWRARAVDDAQNADSDGVHYSAVYTMSKSDFLRLKAETLEWIKLSNEIVAASPKEEILCFNIDLFRLG